MEEEQIYFDDLTKIYNRKGFYKYTALLLEQHSEIDFCLIYWNIRKFKVLNNLFGMQTGDQILIHLADILQNEFSDQIATYGRIGADNFICCVPKQIMDAGYWKDLLDISFSISGSTYHFYSCCGLYPIKDRSLAINKMVDMARLAMESIKTNYMKPYAWYDGSMLDSMIEEQRLVSDFHTGIEQKQFTVYFQPICRADDGLVVSAEALVRWIHPLRGMISPGSFIPLFEKNGLIHILDRFVWNETCAMLKARIDAGKHVVPVSINVSRVEFYNPELADEIKEIVDKYELPINLIKIEITETAYADNPAQVQNVVKRLHDYGFLVLMDDFGSGYSSLNILKNLPIDVLKIDMQFMDNLDDNEKASIILEAIIRMAKWMKLPVVAEGVETRKEWNYLKSMECEMVQGYYFYKPLPQQDFCEVLDQVDLQKYAVKERNLFELDDTIFDIFNHSNSKENMLFYDMIGGMGVMEMTGDALEILQVNRGYYEVFYGTEAPLSETTSVLHKKLQEPNLSYILPACIAAKETNQVQSTQLHLQRPDESFIWINLKLRYIGSRGRHSLFYFAIDNIDELKKAEQERYLTAYSSALLKIFDKVYRLDYTSGMAEVLHTNKSDAMEIKQQYYFKDFFQRFSEMITVSNEKILTDVLQSKESLDKHLEESDNGCYDITYHFTPPNGNTQTISALFFKIEPEPGHEDYLCCIKKRLS
ncbi:MAG: putative bifunctional diguanylate cyclase/phosphodiesterase [Eubacterium sp.]